MRKLNDDHLRILNLLRERENWGECPLTASEISLRCAPRRMSDWVGPKLARLERMGLVRRMGLAFTGERTWDITEAGAEALQRDGHDR